VVNNTAFCSGTLDNFIALAKESTVLCFEHRLIAMNNRRKMQQKSLRLF
jgi:hypothetical protein